MKRYLLILLLTMLNATTGIRAQAPGSSETLGGQIGIVVYSTASGNTTSSVAETLYIGPGIYQIDGVWEIYSKNVWVSPDAVIAGTGLVNFFNPLVAGGTASATLIDGNDNAAFFNVDIQLENADNMVLTDLVGPGVPWNDVGGIANLTIGQDLLFNVTNGDVVLGNHDLVVASNATLSGYLPSRFVVTNGTGHLVHDTYTGSFTFPVGIAEGDYTPAAVDNLIARTIHVLVEDYASSASMESFTNGVNRTWNIYADNATANSVITLQHNNLPGATNQASYNDAASFVTRYGSAIPNLTGETNTSQTAWQSNNQAAGTGAGTLTTGTAIVTASERSLTYAALATDANAATAFYSKSSNPISALPVTLISFTGSISYCITTLKWVTAEEMDFDYFELQSSNDDSAFIALGRIIPKGSNSSYTYIVGNNGTVRVLYRLRMVDLDGREKYSRVVSLNPMCEGSEIVGYPNPVKNSVTISGFASGSRLRLMNATGQTLSDVVASGRSEDIDMSKVRAGAYVVQVMQGDRIIKSLKFIKN
jgi:hypothetical protein